MVIKRPVVKGVPKFISITDDILNKVKGTR